MPRTQQVAALTAMGFPEDRVLFAMEATGATNLEILATWLMDNADKPLPSLGGHGIGGGHVEGSGGSPRPDSGDTGSGFVFVGDDLKLVLLVRSDLGILRSHALYMSSPTRQRQIGFVYAELKLSSHNQLRPGIISLD